MNNRKQRLFYLPFVLLIIVLLSGCATVKSESNEELLNQDFSVRRLDVLETPVSAISIEDVNVAPRKFTMLQAELEEVVQLVLNEEIKNYIQTHHRNVMIDEIIPPLHIDDFRDTTLCRIEYLSIYGDSVYTEGVLSQFEIDDEIIIPKASTLIEAGITPDLLLVINRASFSSSISTSSYIAPSINTQWFDSDVKNTTRLDVILNSRFILWDYHHDAAILWGDMKSGTPVFADATEEQWRYIIDKNIHQILLQLKIVEPFLIEPSYYN